MRLTHALLVAALFVFTLVSSAVLREHPASAQAQRAAATGAVDSAITQNAQRMIEEGRRIFRYDTFGDEATSTSS